MTCYPIPENHGMWWLTTRRGWHRLHAVQADHLTEAAHQDGMETGEGYTRTTVCGRTLLLTYPGMFSRFSMPRCGSCCTKLNVPAGPGSPVNEAYEKRLAAEELEES